MCGDLSTDQRSSQQGGSFFLASMIYACAYPDARPVLQRAWRSLSNAEKIKAGKELLSLIQANGKESDASKIDFLVAEMRGKGVPVCARANEKGEMLSVRICR